jgi:hypothetical protein
LFEAQDFVDPNSFMDKYVKYWVLGWYSAQKYENFQLSEVPDRSEAEIC